MLTSADHAAQEFAIVEAVLDSSEVAALIRTLETSKLERSRAGARHLMTHPAVSAAATERSLTAFEAPPMSRSCHSRP